MRPQKRPRVTTDDHRPLPACARSPVPAPRNGRWVSARLLSDSNFKQLLRHCERQHSRGTKCPSDASTLSLGSKRAQGRPGARCTRGLVCKMHKKKRTRAYRFSGGNPAFPAQWFYGLFRALLGVPGFLATVASGSSTRLIPASGDQDHTTSPSAFASFVCDAMASIASRIQRS
jgi:hypothetical protein